MSSVSHSHADVDFWEFVSCAKCHLPYASDPGRSVPFWLTECGHVICNNHLNPDQSCALCGSAGIQLVPLQQQLDAPMSDWFRSIPSALDSIAYAAKQEVMARQIKFYRSRHQQIRTTVEKLRSELNELKKANELLSQENEQLKQHCNYQQLLPEETSESSAVVNRNGKRQLGATYRHDYPARRPATHSSSANTSTTPRRLTVPVTQHAPDLTDLPPPRQDTRDIVSLQTRLQPTFCGDTQVNLRPVSKRLEKFAYIPPETQHHLILQSSSTRHTNELEGRVEKQPRILQHGPPNSSREAPLSYQAAVPGSMGPPPTPQTRNLDRASQRTCPMLHAGSRQFATLNRRFVPPQSVVPEQSQPSTPHESRRFLYKTSDSNLTGATGNWVSNSGISRQHACSPDGYG